VTGFRKVKPGDEFVNLTSAAVYMLEPAIADYVPEGTACDFIKNIFPGPAKEGRVFGYCTEDYMHDMGTFERYERVKRDFAEGRIK
jgi:mannose-1-phosphate guanylyltransferase / phosphomannomutase